MEIAGTTSDPVNLCNWLSYEHGHCKMVSVYYREPKRSESSRCARPSTRAPMDSRMTSTVAIDMMTAHTMTATVSSLVRPTGNCMATALTTSPDDAILGCATCNDSKDVVVGSVNCNQLDAYGQFACFRCRTWNLPLSRLFSCAIVQTPTHPAAQIS